MEFIRSQRSSPEHDPNTHHVIYGLVGYRILVSPLLRDTDLVSRTLT